MRLIVKNKNQMGISQQTRIACPPEASVISQRVTMNGKPEYLAPRSYYPLHGINVIPGRIKRLEAFENSKAPTKMDFAAIVGSGVWEHLQNNIERVELLMLESQTLATKINIEIANANKAL